MAYRMRAPCRHCGGEAGRIETRNGQDCVFCGGCGRLCYNAPRSETGREPRSLKTRPDISTGLRAMVLERDNATCVLCHRHGVPLDVGHLLSVDAGRRAGLTDEELYHDENLAAMCASCNSGQGRRPVSLRLLAAILRARIARGMDGAA